jgi:hypothetical protein
VAVDAQVLGAQDIGGASAGAGELGERGVASESSREDVGDEGGGVVVDLVALLGGELDGGLDGGLETLGALA